MPSFSVTVMVLPVSDSTTFVVDPSVFVCSVTLLPFSSVDSVGFPVGVLSAEGSAVGLISAAGSDRGLVRVLGFLRLKSRRLSYHQSQNPKLPGTVLSCNLIFVLRYLQR